MSRPVRSRVAWAGAWSRGHNNPRYEELLPRLDNVDRYYVDMHPWWPIRGLRRRIWLPLISLWIGVRYPLVFSTDWRQIRWIRHPVVCDHDDPVFSSQEIAALSSANVAGIVVTTDSVRKRLEAAGVSRPIEVIPQGVSIPVVDAERVRALRAEWCSDREEVVVGLHQPHFEFSSELAAGSLMQMYAVDSLFEIMEKARAQEPRLVLWLVGEPSARVREFAKTNPWVRLMGYQPRAKLMDFVSAFDIGVYPRTLDMMGRSSVKVLEYMACGVPVIGFDVEEMCPVREGKAGIIVRDIPSFAVALVSLAGNTRERRRIGEKGKKITLAYHWDTLSREYRTLLDRLAG